MRQTISGMLAAAAVMMTVGASPAMACYGACAPAPVYVAPAPIYSGCYTGCGGWARERLPDPVQQYYYVNQGPTYTGPGNWAPRPVYQEGALPTWSGYRPRPYRYARPITNYYDGPTFQGPAAYSYRANRYGYRYSARPSIRYGVAPRHGYVSRHSMHRHHGHYQHRHYGPVLRRYN